MRSIKPGRGPSGMGAMGGVFAALFGVFWTVTTLQMGAPFFFSLFGVMFVIMAVVQTLYHYKNATGKNRFSTFDITEDGEELDPWEEKFGNTPKNTEEPTHSGDCSYCPYCGEKVEGKYVYCPKCGKILP